MSRNMFAHAGVEHVLRHAAEERSDLDAIVDVDAGGASADGVNPRQMGRGLLQRVHDAVEVILRIRLVIRIPDRLVAEDDRPVDERRDLAIAAAEIEADAATVKMTAERPRLRVLGRQIARVHDLQRMIEHPLADQVGIESAGRRVAVVRAPAARRAMPARRRRSASRPATTEET